MYQVSIILDDNTLNHHHGVRKYAFSLAKLLRDSNLANVDINLSTEGKIYTLNITDEDLISNGYNETILYGKDKSNILRQLQQGQQLRQAKMQSFNILEELNLNNSQYDVCLFAGPWCYYDNMPLPSSKKYYCISLDAVPNFYALEKPYDAGLWAFAQEHIKAYRKFTEDFDGLLAISEGTVQQLTDILGSSDKVYCLPVFAPSGFNSRSENLHYKIRKQLVLAAPFDLRKGLKYLPDLINMADIESIIIFGAIRCEISDVIEFFTNINVEKIIWYSSVNYSDQLKIYHESLFLLFPSLNEGLGLPVLEALLSGTPAIVSNIEPLINLVPETLILSDLHNVRERKNKMRWISEEAKNTDFRNQLRQNAHDKWSSRTVVQQILNLF